MWLDDLPPLPITPPDIGATYADENGSCVGMTDDVIRMSSDDVIGMRDVIIDSRYHSMISIEANGDVILIKQPIL
jgi:hypothetical protein